MAEHLDMPEGTVMVGATLSAPLNQTPPQTLVEDMSPVGTTFRVSLDSDMQVTFLRQAPGLAPAVVSVDVSSLGHVQRLGFGFGWSPTEMEVTVVERDIPDPARTMVTKKIP